MDSTHSAIPVIPFTVFDTGGLYVCIQPLDRTLSGSPWMQQAYRQSWYSLIWIEKAAGSLTIDGRFIQLTPAQLICIKPDSILHWEGAAQTVGCVIHFTDTFFSLRYHDNVLHQFSLFQTPSVSLSVPDGEPAGRWKQLTRYMQQEYLHRETGADKVIRSYLNILLFEAERLYLPTAQPTRRSPAPAKEERMVRFEQLVEEYYRLHKAPSWYAERLHVTTNYLNRLCKQQKGMTSGALIRQRIITEAGRLLYYTALSVSEVAYELGFESVSYFSTFFKRGTGTTPEVFRKKQRR